MENKSYRVLVVDDHQVMRKGVRALLESDSTWEVCGEAENGRLAVEKTRELSPDLVILDLTMPEMNGLEAARQIRLVSPQTKIVIFSMHESPQVRKEARDAGADAFVSKSSMAEMLTATAKDLLK
ncbi:MAG TPA: response regulator transcription factor [Candidatus Acidoferrales bacterium]|nr:response regulator transcription factor [Candidatus Acidoferrales bacterium]